jgi:uncharacterized protein DUF6894
MHRYYFDIVDHNGLTSDTDGMEFHTMNEAVAEARRALGSLVKDALTDGHDLPIEIHIRDGDEGPVFLTVTMTTEDGGAG